MSDSNRGNSDFSEQGFIPLGLSTPTTEFRAKWNKWSDRKRNRGTPNNRFSRNDYGDRAGNNRAKEYHRERQGFMKDDISLYLQPAMLQDPWAHFTRGPQVWNQTPTMTNTDKKVEARHDSSNVDQINTSKEEIDKSVQPNQDGAVEPVAPDYAR